MLLLLLACSTPEPASTARPPGAVHGVRARAGRTLTVDCAGGGEYGDIATAMAAAVSGDTLEVAPCTYYGAIDFDGKSVTVRGTGGAGVTTLRGSPGSPVVEAEDGETAAVVEGFTLTGGGGGEEPAIKDEFSGLTLRDVVVTGNAGPTIVYTRSGHLLLERVTIQDNTPSEGIVVQARRGAIVMKDGALRCGAAGVGYESEHGAAFVDGTVFDCPGATAVEVFHAPGRVQRVVADGLVLVDNDGTGEPVIVEGAVLLGGATVVGGEMRVRNVVSTGTITATNGLLVLEASVVTGTEVGLAAAGSTVTTRYVDFWQNGVNAVGVPDPVGTDGTSFSADPLFADANGRDFTLGAGSPAIDAGPTDAGYADPDGSRNDLGAYGGPLSLGGGW